MRFPAILTAFVAILPLSGVIAVPSTMLEVQRHVGEKREGSFIVTFKNGVDKSSWVSKLPGVVTHDFDAKFMNGFSGKLDDATLNELRMNPDVESIAEDGIMHTMAITTQ
jgi:cerevisin